MGVSHPYNNRNSYSLDISHMPNKGDDVLNSNKYKGEKKYMEQGTHWVDWKGYWEYKYD